MNPLELTIFGLIGSQLVLAFQVVRLQIRVNELDAQAHTQIRRIAIHYQIHRPRS